MISVLCGPCGSTVPPDVRAIIRHAGGCEKRNPWEAFFRASDKREARRILIAYCGAKPPPPMPEHVKEALRARNADPAAQIVRKARRRADLAVRESIAKMTRALIRKRGS